MAATLPLTPVVWMLALGGIWEFGGLRVEDTEPWLQLATGVIVIGIAP
jgi:nickel/cobalt exporter